MRKKNSVLFKCMLIALLILSGLVYWTYQHSTNIIMPPGSRMAASNNIFEFWANAFGIHKSESVLLTRGHVQNRTTKNVSSSALPNEAGLNGKATQVNPDADQNSPGFNPTRHGLLNNSRNSAGASSGGSNDNSSSSGEGAENGSTNADQGSGNVAGSADVNANSSIVNADQGSGNNSNDTGTTNPPSDNPSGGSGSGSGLGSGSTGGSPDLGPGNTPGSTPGGGPLPASGGGPGNPGGGSGGSGGSGGGSGSHGGGGSGNTDSGPMGECIAGCYPGCIPGCDPECLPPCLLGKADPSKLPTSNPPADDDTANHDIAAQNKNNDALNALLASRSALVLPVQQQAQASKFDTVDVNSLPTAPSSNPAPADIPAKVKSNQVQLH